MVEFSGETRPEMLLVRAWQLVAKDDGRPLSRCTKWNMKYSFLL
jgi:hypothetical protein